MLMTRAGSSDVAAFRSNGASFCVKKKTAPRFRCMTLSQPDCGNWSNGSPQEVPALLTRMCRSEEHTSELQSLMRISYAVFCLKKKKNPELNSTVHAA